LLAATAAVITNRIRRTVHTNGVAAAVGRRIGALKTIANTNACETTQLQHNDAS
jgi:hypothetical protein